MNNEKTIQAGTLDSAALDAITDKLARVSRWIDKFPVPTAGATAMMCHLRDVQEALERRAAPSPQIGQQDERAPTDLSHRLRETADQQPGWKSLLTAAAEEIERYYGGMMAWKRTAEKKDRDWNAERMGRINDRCSARAALALQDTPAATAEPVVWRCNRLDHTGKIVQYRRQDYPWDMVDHWEYFDDLKVAAELRGENGLKASSSHVNWQALAAPLAASQAVDAKPAEFLFDDGEILLAKDMAWPHNKRAGGTPLYVASPAPVSHAAAPASASEITTCDKCGWRMDSADYCGEPQCPACAPSRAADGQQGASRADLIEVGTLHIAQDESRIPAFTWPGPQLSAGKHRLYVVTPAQGAAQVEVEAARDAEWVREPTEQADYWHWDGDEDHAPMIYHVLWSGSANKCFVSQGQYDIDEAIWCENFGGWWLKIEQPSVRAALAAKRGGAK